MSRRQQAPWPFPIYVDGRQKRHCGCDGCALYCKVLAGDYAFAEYPETLAPDERSVPVLDADGKQIAGLIAQRYTRQEMLDQCAWSYASHRELVARKRKGVVRLNAPMI